MSTATVSTLFDHLETLRTCSISHLRDLVDTLGQDLNSRLPKDFLDSLNEQDTNICYQAILICWAVTGGMQVPREMQLKAVNMVTTLWFQQVYRKDSADRFKHPP